MNIIVCRKCGWKFPATTKKRSCKFCGEKFNMGYCSICGQWKEKLRVQRCRECETKLSSDWRAKHKREGEERFKSWIAKLNKCKFSALTEEQWLEACQYFGGCAYCHSEDISARSLFIRFEDGGRYCANNVVPACEKCETALRSTINPFIRMNDKIGASKDSAAKVYGYSLDKLQKIVDYLESKMEVIQ